MVGRDLFKFVCMLLFYSPLQFAWGNPCSDAVPKFLLHPMSEGGTPPHSLDLNDLHLKPGPIALAECRNTFKAVEKGVIEPKAPHLSGYPGVTLVPVGSGGTGSVYRAIPIVAKEKSFIVKIYRHEYPFEYDMYGLQNLKQHIPNSAFYVPWVRRGKVPLTCEIENLKGLDLQSILQDQSIPVQVRERLTAEYESRSDKMFQQISSSPNFSVTDLRKKKETKSGVSIY